MPTRTRSELFIVDNSEENWNALDYLKEWCDDASSIDIATGYFEIGALLALDLLLFYVFWELMLIPMYFLIGIWGGKRRLYATIKFFIYTMAG